MRVHRRRRAVGGVLAVAATVVAGPAAPAYAACATDLVSGGGGDVRPESGLSSQWYSSINASVAAWNGWTGNWALTSRPPTFVGPVFASIQVVDFQAYGYPDGPAQTILSTPNGAVVAGRVYLNETYTWFTTGTMDQARRRADMRTILVHELGHLVPLEHPRDCHEPPSALELKAVMEPTWTRKWALNDDDKAGLRFAVGG